MRFRTLGLALALALPWSAQAQDGRVAMADGSTEAKIASAMTAAPASISANATVLDWPAAASGELVLLRPGDNGWTCLPDALNTDGNDPMCLDETWVTWLKAYVGGTEPKFNRTGIGYMTASGGASFSATDPFATAPTADNHWGHDGPHIMIVVPNPAQLEGLPTSRDGGGPWVMWRGTPYAHVMIPTAGH